MSGSASVVHPSVPASVPAVVVWSSNSESMLLVVVAKLPRRERAVERERERDEVGEEGSGRWGKSG